MTTTTEDKPKPAIARGLEGIALCETKLADVDGQRGRLTIQGYDIRELAGKATFEEVAYLLWHGELPTQAQYDIMKQEAAAARTLPAATLNVLRETAKAGGMHALRMAAATLSEGDPDVDDISIDSSQKRAAKLLAQMPLIVGTYWRLHSGQAEIEVRPEAGVAETLLTLFNGETPPQAQIDALDAYLVAVSEHGLNASTFVGRCIVSTNSDMVSALTGAIGALKGNAHGGVPGPVLDMLDDIGSPANADTWLRAHLAAGKRVMGFGHRVYKVRDPRAQVLSDASDKLVGASGDRRLFDLTHAVEDTTVKVLAEVKPGRELYANVELYAALILHSIGIPSEVFTPVFAVGRTAGWTAHMIEQYTDNRIIRPSSVYVGPYDKTFTPISER
jgi:citrate synthase